MILVYSMDTNAKPNAGERIRSLSAYKQGEVENCEAVRIVGSHQNADLVRADYIGRGIPVLIEDDEAQEHQAVDEVEKPRRGRKPRGA